MSGSAVIAARAAEAPRRPGAYLFLDRSGKLLYVGKANDLRRRLHDHARGDDHPRHRRMLPRVVDVRWIECRDELHALLTEADIIVAFTPPFNAWRDDHYVYVSLESDGGRMTFHLGDEPRTDLVLGGFPHLGKGKASKLPKRSNAGYTAFLRLLWVVFEAQPERIPSRLSGTSPPVRHLATVPDPKEVRDFLSGRSPRLLTALGEAITTVPDFMRRPLRADAQAAEVFYRIGPRSVAARRRRHRLRGPIDRDTFSKAVALEVFDAVGVVR